MSDIEDQVDTVETEPEIKTKSAKAPEQKVDRRRAAALKNLEKAWAARAKKAQEAKEAKARAAEKKTSRSRRKVEPESDYESDSGDSDSGEAEFELIPVSKSKSRTKAREAKPERKIARRSRREPSPEPTPGYDYDSGDESDHEDIPPALARAMSKFFTKAMAKKSEPTAKPKKSKTKASPTVVNHIHVPAQSDQVPKKESKPKNDSTAALRKLMFG